MLKFSVIIPIYKVEKYLKECIESVLRQSFNNFEIILVDDGSPDSCPKLCDEYLKKDSRVKVIHKKNGGLSDARNHGLRIASGEYIIFLDSDDYWNDKNMLYEINNFLLNNNVDMVQFLAKKFIDKSNRFIYDKLYEEQFINTHEKIDIIENLITTQTYSMAACNKVILKSILTENNIWFKKGLLGEDLDWYLNLLMYINTIKVINKHYYVYRIRSNSITTSMDVKNIEDLIYMINKWSKYFFYMSSDKEKNSYLAILAQAYFTAILGYGKLSKKNKKITLKKLNSLKKILKYAKSKKIKLIKYSVNILGVPLTSKLLNMTYKIIVH